MDFLSRDIAQAWRSLRKSPGFAFTALATLALGIGVSTAIFSVVNAVLLRPLPYRDPGRLVHVWADLVKRDVKEFPISTGDLEDIVRETATVFDGAAAVSTFRIPISGDNQEPEQVVSAFVTTNLLTVLGLPVALGRNFVDEDGAVPPPPPAPPPGVEAPPRPQLVGSVILSHGFWQRRYGGDSSVIGRTFESGNNRAQIVGILAPGAELLFPPDLSNAVERVPDIWLAMRLNFTNASRINVQHRVIGRMKPGVTLTQVQRQLDVISADLRQRFPIKETSGNTLRAESMAGALVDEVREAIFALLGAGVFVLLIACANVANLLLVRASWRERELAVRAALGGSRSRLVRQMLAESAVLALIGAALGVVLAQFGVDLLKLIGPEDLPRLESVSIDPAVLVFGTAAAALSASLFGIVPALRASRPDLAETLRATGRAPGLLGAKGLRHGVVMAEVALSFVLLIGCGLMFRSFLELQRINPGFDADRLLTFTARNPRARGSDAQVAYIRQVKSRIEALPGVRAVTAAAYMPLEGISGLARWGTAEAAADPNAFQQGSLHIVLPGYFEVMGTRLRAGRTFTEADNRPDANYIIIDDRMAAQAFPGANAVGQRLLSRVRSDTAEWFEVIGVVESIRNESLATPGEENFFMTDGIFGHGAAGRWAVRTTGDPLALVPAIRRVIREIEPLVPLADVRPLRVAVDRSAAPTRFALVLIATFAFMAVILAAVGLYGVLSSLVRQRTAEIGVRMALGASRASIVRLVLRQGLTLSTIGIVAGLLGALALTQVMASMLVGVAPTDPLTFVSIAVLFFAIASLASWLPAQRAAALDPVIALRKE